MYNVYYFIFILKHFFIVIFISLFVILCKKNYYLSQLNNFIIIKQNKILVCLQYNKVYENLIKIIINGIIEILIHLI